MRVLVTGGRDFADRSAVYDALNALSKPAGENPMVVLHGACPTGADEFADEWATYCGVVGIRAERYLADWKQHGRAAGPIRNQRMIDEGKPDLVLAFPGGRGTADMVKRATAAGIKIIRA